MFIVQFKLVNGRERIVNVVVQEGRTFWTGFNKASMLTEAQRDAAIREIREAYDPAPEIIVWRVVKDSHPEKVS